MNIRDRIKELRRVGAGDLRPNPRNWRTHPKAQQDALRGVLAEIGYADALIVRELPDGTLEIIDGHLRAETTPDTIVPVLVTDLTEDEANKLLATLDPLAAMAEVDPTKLDELLREVQTESEAVAALLTDLAESSGILAGKQEVIEDEVPEPPAKPVTKPGDLWLLGEHRLLCGDSTKAEDMGRVMGGSRINVAFTSPPYASQRKYDESSGFKPIPPDKYVAWWKPIQANVREHLAADGSFFVNIKEAADDGVKQSYVKRFVLQHVDAWEWLWIEEYCWPRPALPLNPNTSRRFKNGWESVFHFAVDVQYKFKPDDVRHESDSCFDYDDQKAAGKVIGDGGQGMGGGAMSPVNQHKGLAYPSNVLANMGGAKVVGHSAAFPVGLPSFFIRAFSDESDAVFDPFMGSGSTLIAAEQLHRRCFGLEISPAYCDVIVARWEKLTGKKAKLEKVAEKKKPKPKPKRRRQPVH